MKKSRVTDRTWVTTEPMPEDADEFYSWLNNNGYVNEYRGEEFKGGYKQAMFDAYIIYRSIHSPFYR